MKSRIRTLATFINNQKGILLLVGLSLVVFWRWFSGFGILAHADWGFENLATLKTYIDFPQAWSTSGLGSIIVTNSKYPSLFLWGILANFFPGTAFQIGERLIFLWPLALLSFLSPFLLLRFFFKDKTLPSIVGSIFFALNTYLLVMDATEPAIGLAVSLIPLLFLAFLRLFHNRGSSQLINATFFVFVACWVSVIEFRILYIGSFICLFYLLYQIYKDPKMALEGIRKLILPTIIFSLLQFFWLLGTALSGSITSNSLFSRGLFGGQYVTILNAFNTFDTYWSGTYLPAFVIHVIPVILWSLPIVAFFTVILSKKRKNDDLLFFACLSLFGILLVKQEAIPFPNLYQFLYDHFPGFNAYRESSKFYIIILIGYSTLVASFLGTLLNSKKGIFKIASSFLVLLLCANLLWNMKSLITGEIGNVFVNRNIPADNIVFNNFVNSNNEYFRVFWVPGAPQWFAYNNLHPTLGAVSLDFPWDQVLSTETTSVENQIVSTLKHPFSQQLLNIMSAKYIAVPLYDKGNDGDMYVFYGEDDNPDIRQWYINELNSISWLKRINIGTQDLVVYENPTYKPPIFSFTSLDNLSSTQNLDNKYDFITNTLKDEFYFTTNPNIANSIPEKSISDIFENVDPQNLNADIGSINASTSVDANTTNSLYHDESTASVYAVRNKNTVSFYRSLGMLAVGYVSVPVSKTTIKTITVPKGSTIYLELGKGLFNLGTTTLNLDRITTGTATLFSAGKDLVPDGSFENGLWQQIVGDCNDYDNNPELGMLLDTADASAGHNSLELTAANHIACTSENVAVAPGKYVFSFDYQSPNAAVASFYIGFNDPNKTVVSASVPITDASWHQYSTELNVPEGATSFNIFLYARSTDGKTTIINRYDAVSLQRLSLIASVNLSAPSNFKSQEISLPAGTSTLSYTDSHYKLANLIVNGSFEQGLWSQQVGDCDNYDNNPEIGMNLDTTDASVGHNSLQLNATRHFACTGTDVSVQGGATYMVSFDYQSPNAELASYDLIFNDASSTSDGADVPISDTKWHTFSTIIAAPLDASGLSIVLYAKESDGTTNNINRYDNVQVTQIPDLTGTYYLVSTPQASSTTDDVRPSAFQAPASTTFELISPTKKLVTISAAMTPFFLAFSESYDPHWQLELNNAKAGSGRLNLEVKPPGETSLDSFFSRFNSDLNSISPFAKPDVVPGDDHFELDDFLNGWYIDPAALCGTTVNVSNIKQGCTINPDGSYDIQLIIEFEPQRWFYLGLIISGLTLVACVEYLVIIGIRRLRKSRRRSHETNREVKLGG